MNILLTSAAYQVLATVEPEDGYYSDETQKMVNHLPSHSKIRKSKHSNGQTLLNAIAGVPSENVLDNMEHLLRQKFLVMMPLDLPDILKRAQLPEWVSTDDPTVRSNHCPNSSFEIHTVPSAMPDAWYKTGTVTVTTGLEGRNAITLAPGIGATANIYQDIDIRIKPNEVWTITCWYKVSDNALTSPGSDYGFKITAIHSDNTTTTTHGIFNATTVASWVRKRMSYSNAKETVSLRIEIIVVDVPASFAFSGETLEVDCIQLEKGGKDSPWRPDIYDRLPYSTNTTYSNIYLAGSDSVHYVDNIEQFWQDSLPTRSSYVSTTAGSYVAVTTTGSVEVTDYYKKTWKFLFENQSPVIRKRGSDVPDDIIRNYNILVHYDGDDWRYLQTETIEALTVFAGKFWVVLQERGSDDSLIRTLHILDIRTPHPEPSYLKSLAAVRIPTDVGIGQNIVRLEFKNEDRQHIYLSTTTNQYCIRLFYDLFFVDKETRTLYLRENYTTISPV